MKSFIVLAVAAATLGADALELIQRRDGQTPRVVQHGIQRKHTTDPIQRIQVDRNKMRKRASGSFQVSLDNEETLYFMNVTIGTPAQPVQLHLDTGSSDLWVNVAGSQLCQSSDNPCASSGTYSANDSTTYSYLNSDFNITYVDGSGSVGDYATDTVSFGGKTLSDQQFGIGYESSSYEGIIGIGYPLNEVAASISNGQTYPNVPQNLMFHEYIGTNAYSLWLDDLNANTGSILFGGVDSSRYTGSLQTVPIVKEQGLYGEFIIVLTGIGANGNSGSISNNIATAALLDSGSSLMYLPDDVVDSIYSMTNAQYDEQSGAAIVDCDLANSDDTIDFTFSSPTIRVGFNELVLVAAESGTQKICILGIGKAGASTPVLGDTFLRSAYVVYDMTNNEISLAQSSFDMTAASNILEITNSTGVPGATLVANAAASASASPGSARDGGEPTVSSEGAAAPTAAPNFNLAALGLAGAGLLLAL